MKYEVYENKLQIYVITKYQSWLLFNSVMFKCQSKRKLF